MRNEWERYKRQLNDWQYKKETIKNENSHLLTSWRAIPWYKFWQRPSFKEQRQMIIINWNMLPPAPRMPFSTKLPSWENTARGEQ